MSISSLGDSFAGVVTLLACNSCSLVIFFGTCIIGLYIFKLVAFNKGINMGYPFRVTPTVARVSVGVMLAIANKKARSWLSLGVVSLVLQRSMSC